MTNTKNTIVADRYSDALVELAQDGKITFGKILTDLNLVKDILEKSQDLGAFLINPLISIEDKKGVIDKVFSKEVDALIVNFLKVLVDKNRFSVFDEVLECYNKSLDDINNITRISVTSAVEMTEDSRKKLKEKLESKFKKSVILDLNINPDIIAGLVIRMGDNVMDMSLKYKLEDLSKSITR